MVNLPAGGHAFQLATHVFDGLVQFVHFVVQILLPLDAAEGTGRGGRIEILGFGMAGEAQDPLLPSLQPPLLSLRKQPPGQARCTDEGTCHATEHAAGSPPGTQVAVTNAHRTRS